MYSSHESTSKRKLLQLVGIAAFGLTLLATFFSVKLTAYAATQLCESNSVMYCGFTSKSGFINTIKTGDKLGHKDLAAVYAAYGLSSSDYTRFINEAKPATFYKNGTVVVSGQTVATDTISWGRSKAVHDGPGMQTKDTGATTLYGNTPATVFTQNWTGYVLFDATGTPEFMVLSSCGNPITGKVVKSGIACKLLNASVVKGRTDQYDFTATSSKTGLATITKYVFVFGDGTSKTVSTSSTSVKVSHTYTTLGSSVAKVTVYGTAPGSTAITSGGSGSCATTINVIKPQCVKLDGSILDQSKYSYRFIATMNANGAKFLGADFNFGDGKSANNVTAVSGNTVYVDHSYDKAGNYNVSAVLRFDVAGNTITAPTCYALVTPTAPPTPECKPGVPVGDTRCEVCKYDASLSPDDARCAPPPEVLPNTGAGNVIAVGAIALIGGFLVYRHRLFKQHKAAYVAADLGVSPLPLAQPLDGEQPLASTPLQPQQPQKKSFLRRRQF